MPPAGWLVGGMEVVRGGAEALPIGNESCSSALPITVTCFPSDPVPAFGDLHRVLSPRDPLLVAFIERGGRYTGTISGWADQEGPLSGPFLLVR